MREEACERPYLRLRALGAVRFEGELPQEMRLELHSARVTVIHTNAV